MQRNNRGFASTSQSNHLTASLSAPARPESLLAPVFRHKTCKKKTKDDEWNWNLSCRHYANGISTHPYGPCAYKYLCLFTWLDLNSTVQYILRYLTSRLTQLHEGHCRAYVVITSRAKTRRDFYNVCFLSR